MAVRAGNYRETAARYAGIGPATLHRWLRDPRPEYVALRAALDKVEAEVEVEVVANLVRLSRTSTAAAVYWLERRHPERWAVARRPTETPPSSGRNGSPTPASPAYIDIAPFATPELLARLRAGRRGAE